MSRPIYETSADLKREWEIALFLEERWDCTAEKLGLKYGLDYFMHRGKTSKVAALEIKVRDKRFDTLFLSSTKLASARTFRDVGTPCLLVVEWPDGIYLGKLHYEDVCRQTWGGRTDRDDAQDMEPVVHWPRDHFTLLAPAGSMPERPMRPMPIRRKG